MACTRCAVDAGLASLLLELQELEARRAETDKKCADALDKTDRWKAMTVKAEEKVKKLGAMPEWCEYKHLHPSVLP